MKYYFTAVIVTLLIFTSSYAGCYFPKGYGEAMLNFGTLDAWQDSKQDAYAKATAQCRTPTVETVYDEDSYWQLLSEPTMGGKIGYATNTFGCGERVCRSDY